MNTIKETIIETIIYRSTLYFNIMDIIGTITDASITNPRVIIEHFKNGG